VPQGGGANAVNVILVDYRGFDTFGEITVLGIAGLVIWALVAGVRGVGGTVGPAGETGEAGARAADATTGAVPSQGLPQASPGPRSLMLVVIARLLLPLAVLVAVFLFLRGHNQPGGGFIAGLVLAIALILQFVANGERWTSARTGADFRAWIGWGLLIAGATGLASWLLDAPFLTSTYDYPVWPIVGAVPLASAAVFDLGVCLTVVGATMVALLAISRLDTTREER
jgi:multicomponent K+:H+ antiporter subunit A